MQDLSKEVNLKLPSYKKLLKIGVMGYQLEKKRLIKRWISFHGFLNFQ